MSAKSIFILCAQLLLVKSIVSINAGLGGCGCGNKISACGNRGFIVQSASPISPTGLYVLSENQIAGQLALEGQLPFLGAVALEGCAANEGNSAVAYSCGNCENLGITAENNNAGAAGLRGCCGGLY